MNTNDFLKKNKVWVAVFVIVLMAVTWFFFLRDGSASQYETITAERGPLLQEVSVTGKLKASELVDLSFERTGKISLINIKTGESVWKSAVLASLSNADLAARVSEERSLLKAEEAELEGILRGSRPEELAVSNAEVESARVDYEDAKRTLNERISDAYTKSDDAIRTQADQFFNSAQSQSPQLSFSTEQNLQSELESGRLLIENMFSAWTISISEDGDLGTLSEISLNNINIVKSFLEKVALALSSASSYSSLSQTTIDAYNADISAARTAVSTSASNLVSAIGGVETTESKLSLARKKLALVEAGATQEDIKAQEAVVERAEASVRAAQAELAKTVIRAPFSGIVTRVDVEMGETVSANTPVVSLISPAYFEIETFVPEADIAKIKIGDSTRVTLDAYASDLFFDANVISIDPAETILEGVSTYKVVFEFIDEEGFGKSGMTANVDVLTASREDVIAIPARSIETDGDKKFVRILTEDDIVLESFIETGLRGSDGRVEIISGVEEWDRVILFFE
ncbi:efflux RND transporter periplasmic adaptor subunit [candidate division KSB1 bacterium]